MQSRNVLQSLNKQRVNCRKPKGAILPLVALLLFILFAMAAFSVDVAYMQLVKIELKTSVDAAARAGGEALSRHQDVGAAKLAAKNLANLNTVGSDPLLLEDTDIIPGKSTLSESTGRWAFVPEATPYNSIRVIGRRTTGAPSGPVPLFFARIFGKDFFQVTDRSTVVRVDRDIMLVVDRSSSMKLAINHPTGNMSTSDTRFDEPPRPDSRWAALELAVQEFVTALGETPQ
ncbi:MAG: pilus assembly protein TadG-related protein, partial [Planctomycetaceae bacterium]|nr:pilus assembly protein TadG-related protein [Planctomycetaceae bacterium]